jgi:hypothetical protein
MGESSSNGRGCNRGMFVKDGPVTWETSYLHSQAPGLQPGTRDPTPPDSLRLVGVPGVGLRTNALRVVGRTQGTTVAATDGEEESEDCIGAKTLGNWKAPGPSRAKAVRVSVNFWRGT